jgi:hypothetical protein
MSIKRGRGMRTLPAGGRLCGGPLKGCFRLLSRLQAVQIIGGALRMGGGGKDKPLVVLQCFQPVPDIGGVILANFGGDFQIGAEEGRSQLGNLS